MTEKKPANDAPTGEFLLDQTEDGRTRVEFRLDADTAWQSLGQVAQDIKSPSGASP